MAVSSGKHEKMCYPNLAKVGVEGSNPFARSNAQIVQPAEIARHRCAMARPHG
jgi:hypothetical protein